jgi:hypothetical protein
MDPTMEALMGLAVGMTTGSADEAANTIEKMGQNEAVTSTQLPREGSPGAYRYRRDADEVAEQDRAWKETGIEFGELVAWELFRDAQLPPGWEKRRTAHLLWNDVVDHRGRKRASFFYKGAMWDRSAFMNLVHRFHAKTKYFEDSRAIVQYEVTDCETVIHTGRAMDIGEIPETGTQKERQAWYSKEEAAQKELFVEVKAWLDERYPDWGKLWGHWED